jgi:hypothetical protein
MPEMIGTGKLSLIHIADRRGPAIAADFPAEFARRLPWQCTFALVAVFEPARPDRVIE